MVGPSTDRPIPPNWRMNWPICWRSHRRIQWIVCLSIFAVRIVTTMAVRTITIMIKITITTEKQQNEQGLDDSCQCCGLVVDTNLCALEDDNNTSCTIIIITTVIIICSLVVTTTTGTNKRVGRTVDRSVHAGLSLLSQTLVIPTRCSLVHHQQ